MTAAPGCAVCGEPVGPDGRMTYTAVGGAEYDVHAECWESDIGFRHDIGTFLAYYTARREPTFPDAAATFRDLTDGHDRDLVGGLEVNLALEYMERAVEGSE